jgi:Flp pilus assembly pilin Flp
MKKTLTRKKTLTSLKLWYARRIGRLQIWQDDHGQDLIEYALMAGFVAIAAGAIMPSVSSSISKIFSRVSSVMASAAS